MMIGSDGSRPPGQWDILNRRGGDNRVPLDVHLRQLLLKFGNSFFLTADKLSERFHFFQNLVQLSFTFLLRKKKSERQNVKNNCLSKKILNIQ